MARNTQGEREERIVEIYATSESLRDQHQDYVGTEESSNTLGAVRGQQPDPVSPPRWPIRAVVVLLVLLSVALLAGLLGLAVKHKIVMDRLKNVTEQRDSLLIKHDCARGWDKFGRKCYLLSGWRRSWNESRELCVSHGADLVAVDSEEEMDFIIRYGGDFWLGATDEASDGLWRWSDGTVLSAYNPSWRRGKPDGDKDKNCLRTAWEKTNYKWTVCTRPVLAAPRESFYKLYKSDPLVVNSKC
uniref:C-type lectin domain-containing protein n=1 Tax=Gadus morhua TaxID=8049 RepID=A0A8C5CBQ4_GADMO